MIDDPLVLVELPDDRNPALLYLRGALRPGSQRAMLGRLNVLARSVVPDATARTFPWHRLTPAHTLGLHALVVAAYAPATARQALAALRGVLRQAWRLELIDRPTFERLTDLPPVEGRAAPAGRALAAVELRALLEATSGTRHAALRDRALLALLVGGGLRRAECVLVAVDDFDPIARAVVVHGKRRRDRVVPLARGTCHAIERWLTARGRAPGPLLCPVSAAGVIAPRGMTADALYLALRRIATRAGVRRFSPHDLRRTLATQLLEQTHDVFSTGSILGHRHPSTTLLYDRGAYQRARTAIESIEDWFAE